MICLTKVQVRYTSISPSNAEEFTSASRRYALGEAMDLDKALTFYLSVKPGLIAAGYAIDSPPKK